MAIATGKISVAFLIQRIQGPSKWRTWFLRFCSVSVFITALFAVIFLFAQCQPARALWTPSLIKNGTGHCWNPIPVNNYDIVIAGLAGVCAAIKTSQLRTVTHQTDITWKTAPYLLWNALEVNIIIIAACIPTLRPLFLVIFKQKGAEAYLKKSYQMTPREALILSHIGLIHNSIMNVSRQVFNACQRRAFSASARQASKVAVLGAAGGIGQPLSLLMKLNPRVTELGLYDIKGGPGVAADIGHINTKSVVTGYQPDANGLKACLSGAEIVLIPAGVPRKPGMTRDDLFNTNASIVRELAKAVADAAPEANTLVISNPVNSTVPICAEVFKSKGTYNPKRLFGVTTLDVVRASRFISQHKGTDPADENITVIGGHSGATIVPLLSQSGYSLSGKDLDDYVYRVQFGGDEVVKAKDGAGSATLSMAMAGARFAESLLKAAQGQKGVIEPTFVDSPLYKSQGIDFFASKVELGPNGVEKIHEVGKVTDHEQSLLDTCLKDLKGNIAKGVKFVKENP
ncbi:MAG: hypothetical protein Q9219_000735 [cf. Caloplaca sp. 3 TL-2023]